MTEKAIALFSVVSCLKFVLDVYFIAFDSRWVLYTPNNHVKNKRFLDKTVAYGPFYHCIINEFAVNECEWILSQHEDINSNHGYVKILFIFVLTMGFARNILSVGFFFRSWWPKEWRASVIVICGIMLLFEGGISSSALHKFSSHADEWFPRAKSRKFGYAFYCSAVSTAIDFLAFLATLIWIMRKLKESHNSFRLQTRITSTVLEESVEEDAV